MAERRSCVAVHFFEIPPWQLFLRFRLYAYGCSEPRKEGFRNLLIRYHGGPVVLDHVWFIEQFRHFARSKRTKTCSGPSVFASRTNSIPGIKGTFALA